MNCRKYDHYIRNRNVTEAVYSVGSGRPEDGKKFDEALASYKNDIKPAAYNFYFGELHGHTNLSDAILDIDDYFKICRDESKLDFCAISDHDHGSPSGAPLWENNKWELIQKKVREYYKEGEFVTLLAYERDSYPYYNNLVLYYKNDTGELYRGEVDGEITREELKRLLGKIIYVR